MLLGKPIACVNISQQMYFAPFISYDHIPSFVTWKAVGGKCHKVFWVYKKIQMQKEGQ